MANNLYTPAYDLEQVAIIDKTFQIQQQAFADSPYLSAQERINDLKLLKAAILSKEKEIVLAMSEDYGFRSHDDTKIADILPTIMGINYAIKRIKKWMKPSKRHVGVLFQPAKGFVMYQPLGVVGIITPWNYPVFLALGPLSTALAAGNRVMIKMSEFTPATNKVLIQLINDCFGTDKVAVFDGGPSVSAHFSQQAYDHLLFTGSTRVGKLVMAAAAKNLTPVTLELGGKSPTIIDDNIDMKDAVSRFILGKTLNAGQTCVAPDYILCPEHRIEELEQTCIKQFKKMYSGIANNPDYTSIINDAQFERLQMWLTDAKDKGAKISVVTDTDEKLNNQQRKIPLTLVSQVSDDMLLMQDEIFGPILAIVSYKKLSDAIEYINARPRPLALYLCSHDKNVQKKVMEQTHAGGMCINDATLQVAQDDMPFGGIGPSGMGQYHGREGFLTFSKAKSVLVKGKFNSSVLVFPPYGKLVHKLVYKFFLR
ncbi:MAG: coniferyl aldehyde dehydrogenase [Alteromonadaceae bacterium]|nr:coniferyl aldehyde dehydrogenase [Alteromonadaceae bacterium]